MTSACEVRKSVALCTTAGLVMLWALIVRRLKKWCSSAIVLASEKER